MTSSSLDVIADSPQYLGMDDKATHKKVAAAQMLLLEPTTSIEKFAHVRTLLTGINPALDDALESCGRELSTISKMLGLDVISLTAENLPEHTDEHKRRKKAILFFLIMFKPTIVFPDERSFPMQLRLSPA